MASRPVTASDGDATIRVIGGGSVTLPVEAYGFSWSPDGSRVAYIDYHGNVYTADADGSHPILIAGAEVNVVRGGHYSHTTWSSDGAVVFWSERKLGDSPLRVVGALGNGDTAEFHLDLIEAFPSTVAAQAIGAAGGADHPDVAGDGSMAFEQMGSAIGSSPETGKVMVLAPSASRPAQTGRMRCRAER